MSDKKASPITTYMRALLDQYSQLIGKHKENGSREIWDVVVLTAADAEQKSAFELQIEGKSSRRELPLDLPLHVVVDPPGVRVGNGGSTLAALEFLAKEYGEKMFEMKILLIHAGGWSQRMPSAAVLGKIFSVLPHGEPPFQMLDLKLALYLPFVPKMGPGVFLVCADDFLVFNLGNDKGDDWTIPRNGFTALAHPSSIAVGRSHGVFVMSEGEKSKMDTSRHVQLLECVEVLQKPNDERMKLQGALLEGNSHQFADGIHLEGEVVYTDSCFYFGVDVMKKLLKFKQSVGDLNCEIDAYGDFMQAVGKNATNEYVHNITNVSQPTDNLIEMRQKVFETLNTCDVHVLALNASTFIHIGTTKELLHHFCRDEDFQDQMGFGRDIYNLWSDVPFSESEGFNATSNKDDVNCNTSNSNERRRNRAGISKFSCVVHSTLTKDSVVEDDSFLEFCNFVVPIDVGRNCILSNCQSNSTLSVPDSTFLHTISVCPKGSSNVEYVTIVFRIDDSLKKATSLKDIESHPFLGSDIGQYLRCQGMSVDDILPCTENASATIELGTQKETSHNSNCSETISLWRLKLYPSSHSMTSSLQHAVSVACLCSCNVVKKIPKLTHKLFSLEDVIKMKDVKDMLRFRKNLHQKINGTK